VKLRLRPIWGWCSGAREFWLAAAAALHGHDEQREQTGIVSERADNGGVPMRIRGILYRAEREQRG
jgi:hypothetical protein